MSTPDLKNIGVDKSHKTSQEAVDAAGKYADRVLSQPESSKGPVGLPMAPGPSPFRVKGSAGGGV